MKWSDWDWKAFCPCKPQQVWGENGSGILALKETDVIIMDTDASWIKWNRCDSSILKSTEAKIVILTSYLDNEKIYPVFRCRACGIFQDLVSNWDLTGCRKVVKGEFAIETEVSQKVESRKNHAELHDDLTARERVISGPYWTKRIENQRIADEFFISLKQWRPYALQMGARKRTKTRCA